MPKPLDIKEHVLDINGDLGGSVQLESPVI